MFMFMADRHDELHVPVVVATTVPSVTHFLAISVIHGLRLAKRKNVRIIPTVSQTKGIKMTLG
jgi:hypothetical protein